MKNEKTLAQNIAFFRKKNKLTQLQLAEKLNYSDKAVSKWERGDSAPDVFVLQKIADIFKISLAVLVGEELIQKKLEKEKKETKKLSRAFFMFALSIGIIWFVATALFVFLEMFVPSNFDYWLLFVFATPLTFVDIFVFVRVRKRKVDFWSLSLVMWTISLSLFLSLLFVKKMWLIFVIGAPAQVIIFFFCKFRNARLGQNKTKQNQRLQNERSTSCR